MNNRIRYLIHSSVSIMLGATIYILTRSRTHIHDLFHMPTLFSNAEFFGDDFVRYAAPDFLWAYSFASALHAVFNGQNRKLVCFTVLLTGAAFELLQKLSIISGTGDMIDVIMYPTAAIIADYIFFKKKENKK